MTNAELEQHVLDTLRRPSFIGTASRLLGMIPGDPKANQRLYYRPLDRALQRLRKQGKIEYRGPVLGWALR